MANNEAFLKSLESDNWKDSPAEGEPAEQADPNKIRPIMSDGQIKAVAALDPETQQVKEFEINRDGAGFLTRLLQGVKTTKTGEFNFLKHKFGDENVFPVQSKGGDIENFIVRKDGGFTLADPKGLEVGDIADIVAPVLESIPGIAGSIGGAALGGAGTIGLGAAPAAIAGGAAGDIIGGTTRQIAAELIPGEEDRSIASRAGEVGLGVAAGLGGEALQGGARLLIKKNPLSPFFKDARFKEKFTKDIILAGKQPSEVAGNIAEGRRLEREIPGLQFDAPQLAATETALGARRVLEQTPGIGDQLGDIRAKQINALTKNFDSTLSRVAGGDVSSAKAGEMVGKAIKNARSAIIKQRSEQARPLFDAVDSVANGQPVIQLDRTLQAIDDVADSLQGNFTTDSANKILVQLQKMKDGFIQKQTQEVENLAQVAGQSAPGTAALGEFKSNAKKFAKDMSNLSQVIYGKERLVSDIPMSKDQFLARKVLSAMEDDLGETISKGGIGADAATALNEARSSWAKNSAKLEQLRENSLEKLFKQFEAGDEEKMAKKLVASMSNKNIRKAMSQISKIDPDAANNMRAASIKEMFTSAFRSGDFSPKVFNTVVNKPGNREKLFSLFEGDAAARGAINKIVNIAKATKRIDQRGITGKAGSQTAPMQGMIKVMQKLNIPLGSQAGELLARAGSKLSNAENFGRALVDPDLRNDFLILSGVKESQKLANVTRAATRLIANLSGDGEENE